VQYLQGKQIIVFQLISDYLSVTIQVLKLQQIVIPVIAVLAEIQIPVFHQYTGCHQQQCHF